MNNVDNMNSVNHLLEESGSVAMRRWWFVADVEFVGLEESRCRRSAPRRRGGRCRRHRRRRRCCCCCCCCWRREMKVEVIGRRRWGDGRGGRLGFGWRRRLIGRWRWSGRCQRHFQRQRQNGRRQVTHTQVSSRQPVTQRRGEGSRMR